MRPFNLRFLIPFTLVVLLLAACGDTADDTADTTLASTTTTVETTTTLPPTTTVAPTTTTVAMNPKVVSERLGHASLNITLDTYSHVLPGLQEAAAVIDRALAEPAELEETR